MTKKLKKLTWEKGIQRIVFPCHEYDPIKAIESVQSMKGLPKYRLIGYEIHRYVGKDGFTTFPAVFIQR